MQNYFQPLHVFRSVEPRIAVTPRWLQQAFAFIEPEGLRMDAVLLGHRRDHVRCFGFCLCHIKPSPRFRLAGLPDAAWPSRAIARAFSHRADRAPKSTLPQS